MGGITDDIDRSHITIANASTQTLYVALGSGAVSDVNPKESLTQGAIDAGAIIPGDSSTRGFDLGDIDNFVYVWRKGGPKTPAAYLVIDGAGVSVDAQVAKWYLTTTAFDTSTMIVTVKDSPAYAARWYALAATVALIAIIVWLRFRAPTPAPIAPTPAPATPAPTVPAPAPVPAPTVPAPTPIPILTP